MGGPIAVFRNVMPILIVFAFFNLVSNAAYATEIEEWPNDGEISCPDCTNNMLAPVAANYYRAEFGQGSGWKYVRVFGKDAIFEGRLMIDEDNKTFWDKFRLIMEKPVNAPPEFQTS